MRLLGLGLVCLAASAATVPSRVTFHKQVLPILQKNCQGCHRPGEAAPMSFLTYNEVRPWAKAIRQAVLVKKMPPWFAEHGVNKFSNDRSLAQSDIDTLIAWTDSGAKEGNPKDGPAPVAWLPGWNIGKPDVVIEMPNEYAVPMAGTIDYQYIVIPTGFSEDKWVRMAEVRPGNRAVVHHVIAFVREPSSKWMRDAKPGVPYSPKNRPPQPNQQGNQRREDDGFGGEFLVGYAPGTVPVVLDSGRAKLIKAGSDIVFQMHYTANGKEAIDRTKIGMIFATEAPAERVMTIAAGTNKFTIPAGASNHRVDAAITLHDESTLVQMLPHMHLRGKAFSYRAVYPTGETENLLNVPKYSFSWQLSYFPARKTVFPKGTKIECTAYYDNSANNPSNPDPKVEVRYGDQSWEEMMFGFFEIAFDAKKNPADILRAPRKPAQPATSGSEE